MSTSKSATTIVLLALAAIGLAAGALFLAAKANEPITIAEAVTRCGRKADRDVKVAGHVAQVHQLPLVDMSVYRFVDDSASIWVLSKKPAPRVDREMTVRGSVGESSKFSRVYQGFIGSTKVCGAAARVIGFVAGECILFEDRRE